MTIRKSYVSGSFYEEKPSKLKKQIKECFEHDLGPGHPDTKKKFETVKGVIVPHAGYAYSGMCAAHSYKVIRESGDYDLFIVIGFSHSGKDTAAVSTTSHDWETPLGVVKTDSDFINELISKTDVYEDNLSHETEHSIEVQLPFIQYLYGNHKKFVPLSVSHNCDYVKLGSQISKIIKGSKKRVCVIASSDFTHFGPRFNYTPFYENIPEGIKKIDNGAIEFIRILDSNGFIDYVKSNDATICGKGAIALMLEIIKNDVNRIELLNYYTSADLSVDDENSVSYVSMVFERIKI